MHAVNEFLYIYLSASDKVHSTYMYYNYNSGIHMGLAGSVYTQNPTCMH